MTAPDTTSPVLAGRAFDTYCVWRQQHSSPAWFITAHSFKARTDAEAQARVRSMFSGAGLSSMSLVAVKQGEKP